MTTLTNASTPNLSEINTAENTVLTIGICLENADHLLDVFRNAGGSKNSPDGYVSLSNHDIADSICITDHIDKAHHGNGLSDQRSLINPFQIINWVITTKEESKDHNYRFGDFILDAVTFHDTANMLRVLEYAPRKELGKTYFTAVSKPDFNCHYCPKVLAYNVKLTVNIVSLDDHNQFKTIRIKFDPMIQTRENP